MNNINRDGVKKIIKVSLSIIIIGFILFYIYISFNDYIKGPIIIISEPENGSTISTSTVLVKGQVLHIQDVKFNGKSILIDKQGYFSNTLLLSPGYNVSLIEAKDKFNRTIEYKLELVYQN